MLSNSSSHPTIKTASPVTQQTGTTGVSLSVSGTNLTGSSTMKLQMTGQPDIVASGVSSSGGSTFLDGTLDLTGAATGSWDVVVTNASGTAVQTGGFSVTP